ncbi:MAG: class I SAM-dependent methyltransferase [Candidatus Omnitrophica bacterium]|nr:class I SAM-dependent methyltransferase [Candidatus Omnitrophota bacterium]
MFSFLLRDLCAEVYGVDISQNAVEIANRQGYKGNQGGH